MSSPAQIAVYAASHPNPDLHRLWRRITVELARINPGLLRRITNQLRMSQTEYAENARVVDQLDEILLEAMPA